MLRRQAAASAVLAALLALPAAAWADTNLRFTTGVDYSTGDYGQKQSTDVIYAPLTAKLYTGHWTFRASTGWLSVDGPAAISTVDEDGGGVDTGGVGGAIRGRKLRQGFGDTYLGAKYSFEKLGGGPLYFDPQVKVRLPTGDHDKGLGVGATDLIVDGELGADWRTKGVYVDVGRRFQGDSSTLVRQDVWAYSAGGWAKFDARTELGIWYYTRDPSVRGFDRPREIGAYVSRRINAGWRVEFSLYEGLSESSEDFGGAFTITWRPGSGHRRR
jgi:hypothetical protein